MKVKIIIVSSKLFALFFFKTIKFFYWNSWLCLFIQNSCFRYSRPTFLETLVRVSCNSSEGKERHQIDNVKKSVVVFRLSTKVKVYYYETGTSRDRNMETKIEEVSDMTERNCRSTLAVGLCRFHTFMYLFFSCTCCKNRFWGLHNDSMALRFNLLACPVPVGTSVERT